MVWVSAGHAAKSLTHYDPGAVNLHGLKEGDLTIEFRNLVLLELNKLNVKYATDNDNESLAQYLKRLTSNKTDLVVEYHLDSASPAATGCTSLVEEEADRLDKLFATELANSTSLVLGIKNRGVISETESHRGKLGLMREEGIICLHELCFISNDDDIRRYNENKHILAKEHAKIIKKYEDLVI